MGLCVVAFLCCICIDSAGPLSAEDLARLLRASERSLQVAAGQVSYSSRTTGTDGTAPIDQIAKLYEFCFHGSRRNITRHNPETDAPYSTDVWCVNERYGFTLGKQECNWILLGIDDVNARRDYFTGFHAHFDYVHTFARSRLADLLAAPGYAKRVTPAGRNRYRVDVERLDQNADGLSRLTAIIALEQQGRYAYIKQAQGEVRWAGTRTSLTVVNTVMETAEGPELVESKETVKPLDDRSPGETEYVRIYEVNRAPASLDESVFYVSHYGFPEPDLSASNSTPAMNRFIVFFVLLLAGVVCVVIGRNLRNYRAPVVAQP